MDSLSSLTFMEDMAPLHWSDLHLLSEVSPSLSSVLEELTLSSCDLARPLDLAILVKAFGRTMKAGLNILNK